MQRGTRRRRSSPDEDEAEIPPRRRQRQGSPLLYETAVRAAEVEAVNVGEDENTPIAPTSSSSSVVPNIIISASDRSPGATLSSTSPSLSQRSTVIMGHRVASNGTNGFAGSNGHQNLTAEAGPSTSNGHASTSNGAMSSDIRSVQPNGTLMYEDDRAWSEDDVQEEEASTSRSERMAVDGEEHPIWQPKRSRMSGNGRRMPIDREEVVRLILQGLRDIGYDQSASVLEAESGYRLSTSSASDFQAAILGGRWSESLALMSDLGIDMSSTSTPLQAADDLPASSSVSMISMKTSSTGNMTVAQQAKFLIAQQKYLEYLELGQQKKALNTLRQELAPSTKDSEVLHNLSGYMMCLDKDDLYERASWDGAAGSSRRRLLEHLQMFISPQVMVPERRLATLLDQARQFQTNSCIYHQNGEPPSLYTDHECNPGQFPSITTHVLADHSDEVWRIEWSPDGLTLASAGKDKQVVLWVLESTPKADGTAYWSVRPSFHLAAHDEPVDVMAWSPDGRTLVAGADKKVYLWDVKTGEQKKTSLGSSPHGDQISAIQWRPDGSEFLVASMDCKLVFYNPSGDIVRQWSFNHLQIIDFIITSDSSRLIAITTSLKRIPIEDKLEPTMSVRPSNQREGAGGPSSSGNRSEPIGYREMEHALMVIRLSDKEIVDWSEDLGGEITSIKPSWDGKRVLINCNPDELQIWAVEPQLKPLKHFKGHLQRHFLIRSAFGALKDRFVLSGSEDSHVYVWQSNQPNPVQVLEGHDNSVNCVAWNPVASRRIFASCSDDWTVRIWQPPEPMDSFEAVRVGRVTDHSDELVVESAVGGDGDGVVGAEVIAPPVEVAGTNDGAEDEGMVL